MIRIAGRGEHGVERCGELGVPVPDQELEALGLIIEVHQQIPGLLGHPLPRRVSGDPGQVHAAGAVLDEEQHVQALQEYGIDVEEVDRQDRLRLGVRERPPGLPGPSGRGVNACVFEDLPHCRRGQPAPEPGQLTVDAPVSPARVVPGHLQYQHPYRLRSPGPAGSTARIGPVPPDEVGVPAQQGTRGDDQAQLAELAAGQQPGQRSQDRPVGPGQPRGLHLALEHGDLMTQDEDLGVLGAVGTGQQGEPAEHAEHHQVSES